MHLSSNEHKIVAMFLVSNGALPYCSVIAWGQKYLPYLKLKPTALSTQKHKDEFKTS